MLTPQEITAQTQHLTLQSTHLRLRPLTAADEQAQIQHAMNPAIMAQISDPLPREQVVQRVRDLSADWQAAEGSWHGLAVDELGTSHFTGLAFFRVISYENQSVELGYRFHPDYWRRGYATETGRALTEFLDTSLQVRKLVAYCVAENEGSGKVLENLGFSCEGCLKQHSLLAGRWQDELVYGKVLR